MSSLVVVFAKRPIQGKVKTRLAKKIGIEKTLKIYQLLLHHTEKEIEKLKIPYIFHYDDEQKGNNLGEKLIHSFHLFKKKYSSIIFLGSDFPFLSIDILGSAIEKIKNNDVVIGPSYDGGYYLIALKDEPEEIFYDIDWSTNLVLSQTMKRIINKKYFLLPTYYDIDTFDDLKKFINENNKNELAKKFSLIL